jgi:predicted permease
MKLFSRSRIDADIDEELRSHVQLRADDLAKSGMDRDTAERQARIEFGGHLKFKEETRQAAGIAFVDTLIQDVRHSVRGLRKSPGFAITAVLTLALGIGANAIVFSVLNAFILRPLDVPDAGSLYQIERGKDREGAQSYPDYVDLRDRNHSFEDLAGYDITVAGLDNGDNNPTRVWVDVVTGNYFDALHVQPQLGRLFHGSDEHGPNSAPYIVLTHAYWHSHFHDDPGVVGRVVRLNKHPYTIVGVAPPWFHGTMLFFGPDAFVPLVNEERIEGKTDVMKARGNHWIFQVVGHLKPGVTPAQAVADLNAIGADLERMYPKEDGQMTFALARPGLYGDFLGPVVQGFLLGLMLLAALILVAACANLGSLFAARAADRSREVALKLALGASRARVLRHLFTEAVLIALAGGAAGVAASLAVLRALSAWQPFSRFPIHVAVMPDATVYVVALFISLASGLLFSVVPVRQTLRTDPYEIVKAGSPLVGRRWAIRDLLLVGQIAICAVLVTSSIVAVRGLVRSTHVRFGFEPQNAMLVDTDLTMAGYTNDTAPAMQKRMIEALTAVPGVHAVGTIDQPPLWAGWTTRMIFTDRTTDLRPAMAAANPVTFCVSPDYFQAAGTALLAGRSITWHDDKDAPRVAVINQEFARRIFGSATNAIGGYFKLRDGTRVQAVGVVEDGKYTGIAERPQLAMFLPFSQSPSTSTWLVVRSPRDPQELAAAARVALHQLDAGLPLTTETWNNELNSGIAQFGPRMATASLGVLGVMGAMLSVTGIFGLAAYSVSKRKRELGIRVALGARRGEVLRTALGRAIRLLCLGSAAGLLLGVLASRVLAFLVYQASPRDPVVVVGVALAMLLLGLLGTWIPAQRALAVSPLLLMREE